jgi:hypothetical protein
MLPDDPQDSLEYQLSHLDFSAESQVRQQLYRRLKRQAARPIYHQPVYVTVFSRLGAATLLALVFGFFVGALRLHSVFPTLTVTAISAPHMAPVETPGTAIAAANLPQVRRPYPLPTPLAPTLPIDENRPVSRTSTRYP